MALLPERKLFHIIMLHPSSFSFRKEFFGTLFFFFFFFFFFFSLHTWFTVFSLNNSFTIHNSRLFKVLFDKYQAIPNMFLMSVAVFLDFEDNRLHSEALIWFVLVSSKSLYRWFLATSSLSESYFFFNWTKI